MGGLCHPLDSRIRADAKLQLLKIPTSTTNLFCSYQNFSLSPSQGFLQ